MKVDYSVLSKFYELIDVIYFTDHGHNPRKEIIKMIPDCKTKVLELCCGTMANGIRIGMNRKKAEITGIDLSEEMLHIARKKAEKLNLWNIKVLKGDALHTDIKEKFDFVLISLVLHEMEPDLADQILKEAHRVLKPGGKLIVLEWEKQKSILKRLLFWPVKKLEPEPFRQFFLKDKVAYFKTHHFKTVQQIHCDYSCVFKLEPVCRQA